MVILPFNSTRIDRVMYKTLHCVFYNTYLKYCLIILFVHAAVVFGIHEEYIKLAFDLSAVFPTFLTIFTVATLANCCITALAICTTADASRLSRVFPTTDIEIDLIEPVRIILWWILVAVHLLAGFFSPIMCVHMDPEGSLQLASYLWLKIPIAVMYIINSWYFTSRIISFVKDRCIVHSELHEVSRLDYTEIPDTITQNVEVYIIES
jgi:hypothetical protein